MTTAMQKGCYCEPELATQRLKPGRGVQLEHRLLQPWTLLTAVVHHSRSPSQLVRLQTVIPTAGATPNPSTRSLRQVCSRSQNLMR